MAKCYYPWSYTDTIGVAWSGGFAYSTNSKSITYYNMLGTPPSFKWAKTSKGSKQALADGTPAKDANIIFASLFIQTAGCEQTEYWKNKYI